MFRRIAVDVGAAPTGQTNTYLLGDPPLLVDPAGPIDELPVDSERVDHVAVTHTHPDHVGGLPSVRAETDTTVWAIGTHTDRFVARTGVEPDRTFGDGEEVGPTGVTVLSTPGHAPDHVAFVDDSPDDHRRTVALVGDLAMAEGSVMVGTPDGDMRSYLASLRRLAVKGFETAYPGHGPPIADPETRFARLIAHRLERESRVEAAVRNGASELPAIVDAAYDKDLTGVRELAERTVVAHLEKLAVEGQVAWDGTEAKPA